MNLLDRYVSAVKRYLPAGQRDDVGRELHGLLEERLEAESETLGRALTDRETAAVLKRHGHPYKVAVSYHPSKALVGAESFALYKRVMTKTVSAWFFVVLLVGLYDIFSHTGPWAIVAVPAFWHTVADILLFLFFAITMLFHVYGGAIARSGVGWYWRPSRLPAFDGTWLGISLSRLIIGSIVIMSLLGVITSSAHEYSAAGTSVAVGDSVVRLLPVLQVLALSGLLLNSINLFQRHWTRVKLYGAAALAIAGALVLSWIVVFFRVLSLFDAGSGEIGNKFLSIWPEFVLKAVLVGVVVLLVRSALRSWRRAQTPGLPLI